MASGDFWIAQMIFSHIRIYARDQTRRIEDGQKDYERRMVGQR